MQQPTTLNEAIKLIKSAKEVYVRTIVLEQNVSVKKKDAIELISWWSWKKTSSNIFFQSIGEDTIAIIPKENNKETESWQKKSTPLR